MFPKIEHDFFFWEKLKRIEWKQKEKNENLCIQLRQNVRKKGITFLFFSFRAQSTLGFSFLKREKKNISRVKAENYKIFTFLH